jgi:hypothetical protein
MSKEVDARLKIALQKVKKVKAARKERWEQLKTKLVYVPFVLTGFPMKGHRKNWFETRADVMVHKVLGGLEHNHLKCSNIFVTQAFIMDTVDCWLESGFSVKIEKLEPPKAMRLAQGEIYVQTWATLHDITKPFAQYWVSLTKKQDDIEFLKKCEKMNVEHAMARIQDAILKEADLLAESGLSGISMPRLYQTRQEPDHSLGCPVKKPKNTVYQLKSTSFIQGMPYEPLVFWPEVNDYQLHFLPLAEDFVQPGSYGSDIWKLIE